jgi:hypothetical protein
LIVPIVMTSGPYRFFFYSSDRAEPCHVHVASQGRIAKFWLVPVRLERSRGFSERELLQIQRAVERNQHRLMEKWDEFFEA